MKAHLNMDTPHIPQTCTHPHSHTELISHPNVHILLLLTLEASPQSAEADSNADAISSRCSDTA